MSVFGEKEGCPKCGGPCETLVDEVDIGVGVQRHVRGWDCPACGPISVCYECGAIDGEHFSWCANYDEDNR